MKDDSYRETKPTFKERFKIFIGRYLRLILGLIILLLGIVFMFIPFIPLGYLFIFMSLFFLATFFPPLKKLLKKLRKRDKHGIIDRAEDETSKLEGKISEKLDE